MTELRNPAALQQMRDAFDRQGVMRTLGVSVADVQPGRVTLVLPFRADLTQHHGFLHAGVVTTAMDSAAGFAAFTLMDADAEVLTAEFKASFLNPARGDSFRMVGEVLKSGRTLTFCEARAYAVTDGGETLIATLTATMMSVRNPALRRE
ncbi:PaaI family thioesterase [Loktanella sp. SALINAS62]|uniref:PaaI family thioesterase n=1 Tax=Loktanella sp. SALINAS62 TaxID=2706124 RepID=UPI001B8D8D94|nr:PaaI family thioesterase [Loktanella sp. SALINAS62]MBS1300874.1 PaaI family thioesterase [Loktanella sp. SALINAS62]